MATSEYVEDSTFLTYGDGRYWLTDEKEVVTDMAARINEVWRGEEGDAAGSPFPADETFEAYVALIDKETHGMRLFVSWDVADKYLREIGAKA